MMRNHSVGISSFERCSCVCATKAMSGATTPRIVARPVTSPDNIFKVAAMEAFWDLSLSELRSLTKFADICIDANSLYDVVKGLIDFFLPEMSAANKLAILQKRCHLQNDCIDELLQCGDVLDILSTDDIAEVKAARQKVLVHEQATKVYRERFVQERTKVHGKPPRGAANPKNRSSPMHGFAFPAGVPVGAWTQKDAKVLMPPNSYLWHGSNGTWQYHVKGHRRGSKSWAVVGGHTAAMKWCVASAWQLYLSDHSLPESACPIKGVFGIVGGASSSSGR